MYPMLLHGKINTSNFHHGLSSDYPVSSVSNFESPSVLAWQHSHTLAVKPRLSVSLITAEEYRTNQTHMALCTYGFTFQVVADDAEWTYRPFLEISLAWSDCAPFTTRGALHKLIFPNRKEVENTFSEVVVYSAFGQRLSSNGEPHI